ncbi:MAG: autotransporter-associated beta strand repeat-containing protein [Kiritimatiellales bacterium]
MKNTSKRLAAVLAAVLALSSSVQALDGTWTNRTSGLFWGTAGNWSGGTIADGSTCTADFSTLDITADTTVRIDGQKIIGNLIFGDTATNTAASWILSTNSSTANTLTLSNSNPTITVNALGTTNRVLISAVLAGLQGLTKEGAGTLTLSANNTYKGATRVSAGKLRLATQGLGIGGYPILLASTNITVANGGTFSIGGDGGATNPGMTLASGTILTVQNGGTLSLDKLVAATKTYAQFDTGSTLSGTGQFLVSSTNTATRNAMTIGSLSANDTGGIGFRPDFTTNPVVTLAFDGTGSGASIKALQFTTGQGGQISLGIHNYNLDIADSASTTNYDLTIGTLTLTPGTSTQTRVVNKWGPGTVLVTNNLAAASASFDLNITAGRMIFGGSVRLKSLTVGASGTFQIGNGGATPATSTFDSLNQNSATGTFKFVFGTNGVGTINVNNTMDLSNARIVVDGTAYTGAGGTFTLFDSVNLVSLADTNNIMITGFGFKTTHIVQDQTDGKDWVQLVVDPEPSSQSGLFVKLVMSETSAQRIKVLQLGSLTNAPASMDAIGYTSGYVATENLKAIYYDTLDWKGSPTKVFAWLGFPTNRTGKVPGIVLVHGGGGTAYKEWVTNWTARGFAAISIAVEGQTDVSVGVNSWQQHAWPGPKRIGIYADSAEPLADQWIYHAVADTVLANSLLRSLPEVDADKVGIMGISWGGVISSTTMGIDGRFAFAIPTYGCGHLFDALGSSFGAALGANELYKQVWDPMVRMSRAQTPALWLSWPTDPFFPLDCLAATYHAAPGPHMVSLIPGMGHSHPAGWNPPDSYAFAESIVRDGQLWCRQISAQISQGVVRVEFSSTNTLDRPVLISTTNTGFTGSRTWVESPAAIEQNGSVWHVTATNPAGTTAWFVNVRNGNLTASSDYQE